MIVFLLALACSGPPALAPYAADIARLLKPSADPAQNQAAAGRLGEAGPGAFLPVLRAWPKDDPVASHWLRTVADDIAARHTAKLPTDELLRFAKDPRSPGKARRVALTAIERHTPGSIAKLLPAFLNDPELGPDAVADRIAAAELAPDARAAKQILLEAYAAATDVEQVQTLATKLTAAGEQPDVVKKLGIVSRWSVVGPFDVSPAEGLKGSFPPETKPDLSAEYDPKGGKIRWVAARPDAEGRWDLVKLAISPEKGAVTYAFGRVTVPAATRAELRIGAVATPAALQALERAGLTPLSLVRRHAAGDWGECDAHDRQANEDAVLNGDRVFSVYVLATGEKVWVITEHDRSSTCVLTPSWYSPPASRRKTTVTITATDWLTRAGEYRVAALIAPDAHPKMFLALHAAELLLKGLILRQAGDLGALSHTHDLGDLLRAVGVDPADYPALVHADPKMTFFRYPKEPRPDLDAGAVLREADALWNRTKGVADA